jgi:hypothetical protein
MKRRKKRSDTPDKIQTLVLEGFETVIAND